HDPAAALLFPYTTLFRSRADGLFRQAASRNLEYLLRRFAMPRNSQFRTGSFFLIDRAVLDCVRQFREHSRVTFALVAWTGFEQRSEEHTSELQSRFDLVC